MKRINENRELIGKICFFTGIVIELVFMLINLGAYPIPHWLNIGRFMQLASFFFLGKILLTKYSKREWIVNLLVLGLGVASFIATGRDEWVLRVLLMLVASKNIDSKEIAKYVLYVTLSGSIIIVVLSLIGIGQPMINAMDYGRDKGIEMRWTFGMGHPNHIHGLLWYIVTLLIYLYHKRFRWYHYFGLTVLNIVLFLLTVSRTGFLMTQFLLCISIFVTYYQKERVQKMLHIIGHMAIIGTVMFTIYVGKCGVHGKILETLDRLLTYRLTFIDWYGDPATWRWLSQSDDIGRATIDVTYGAIINAYGYIIMFAYTVLNCLLQVRLYKEKNIIGMVLLLSCILYGMMENYMNAYFLMYNFVFILLIGRWDSLLNFGNTKEA